MLGIKSMISGAARKAGLATAGAFMALVGIAFLTTAAWISLAAAFGALVAASTIGFVFLGAACLVLALAFTERTSRAPRRQPPRPQPHPTAETPAQLVVLSFLQGLEQGQQARRAMQK